MGENFWRKCSVCKSEIGFNTKYFVCSVSSCNKKRSPIQFCTVSCWDAHNAVLNHMNAGADEEISPKKDSENLNINHVPKRRLIANNPNSNTNEIPKEILVVVSKLKNYINSKSGMNTSNDCAVKLSDIIREKCDKAIENAKINGRKTVMSRDFQ